ncbi:Midasin [Wickerhamomyces ciferrii]|uniref:Midasin n=1 Tax=Wickerhamomyces ciferrii (strain ATCC 14091 / BCRC 22168 / CBS 111 / JCM 3599 / NBRC 0793 / NRRL Y-1031 F-60-10) TaxID=1206466 RepID=K0KQH8_WICCF|nr:Midasin [Wickerhamomyces ciferrii]CCH43513.1 Midasin [Wickerhamomyces ciferrii]
MAKNNAKKNFKGAKGANAPKGSNPESVKPVVVSQKDLDEPVKNPIKDQKKSKSIKPVKQTTSVKKDEEYQSGALSKKEQRLLKKAAAKVEVQTGDDDEDEEESDEENSIEIAEDTDSEMEEYLLDLEKLARSDSESDDESDDEEEDEDEEKEDNKEESKDDEDDEDEEDEDEDEEDEDEEDIPLSDVEVDSDADIVPHSKLTINNVGALKNALTRIQLPWEKHSFQQHQSLTSKENVEPQIKDIYDDTEREVAFYKQALSTALEGRSKLLKLKIPFSRPLDYFAEMIKSDEHMDRLKSKLVKEASEKKASVEARRQRELKKFGKQVQNATLQERQKQKRETLDKIKGLKRKRQDNEISTNDFNVAIEEATADKDERKERNKRTKPNAKRAAKDQKYGSGGMKRFKRKNDAESSADMRDFSQRKMKGKASRPGKSKRNRK